MRNFPSKGKKRYHSRPLRKTYRSWQSPEAMEEARLERRQERADSMEWTPEELDRIWRSASG